MYLVDEDFPQSLSSDICQYFDPHPENTLNILLTKTGLQPKLVLFVCCAHTLYSTTKHGITVRIFCQIAVPHFNEQRLPFPFFTNFIKLNIQTTLTYISPREFRWSAEFQIRANFLWSEISHQHID